MQQMRESCKGRFTAATLSNKRKEKRNGLTNRQTGAALLAKTIYENDENKKNFMRTHGNTFLQTII
jgi:hypothetical protein